MTKAQTLRTDGSIDIVPSVCPHDCPSTCALEVERLDPGRIGRVRGAKSNDYTDGVICAKVGRYAERVHHPDRLTQPLRRTGPKGSGAFEPISWDAAMETLAGAFAQAADQHGAQSVWPYMYAGTMGLVQRKGIGRLTNSMKYSRIGETICSSAMATAWKAGFGEFRGLDPREMAEADLIVIWGLNAVSTHIHAWHHAQAARKKRGAKIIVVDPYRTPTAKAADQHIAVRPGTDGALACAMMNVMLAEGLADRDYLAKLTDFGDDVEAHLATRGPAWAAQITGLDEATIVAFARQFGRTKNTFLKVGYGMSRTRNAASSVHAVSCLPAVSGAWKQRGGGALMANASMYKTDHTLIQGLDALDPSTRVLDMSRIGPILTGDKTDLGDGPPVKAMLIQNTNPMAVAPEHDKVRAGFERDDLFVCVHEQFMTETAKMADLVLPATMFLEHDDLYHGGGHFYLQTHRAVIEPYAQSRTNHWVICDLAKRLGAKHRGFEMSEWEIIDDALRVTGYPDADTLQEKRWHSVLPDFYDSHFLGGFPTSDGKFHFKPDWAALGPNHAGIPTMPDHWAVIDEATAEKPFRLVTAPARNFLNTSFTETPTSRKGEGRPRALIHPDDAAKLGLADDDPVTLGNEKGVVTVHARLFDGLQRGVTVVEGIWPNGDFVNAVGINRLTSADAAAPVGGAVFHDTAVWIEKARP